jgi:CheY-like chemotaxis protein
MYLRGTIINSAAGKAEIVPPQDCIAVSWETHARRKRAMDAAKGKILVMDDEEIVRLVAGEILKYLNYEVEFARTGDEAIALCSEALHANKPFHVAIMDLSIPNGMGGKEAVIKLRALDPNLKVLVSSGHVNDPVMLNFQSYGFAGAVVKPYEVEELGAQVEKVLPGQSE